MALNLKPLHILVIEEMAPLRELIVSVLKTQGVGTVTFSTDTERGFEAFCRNKPDIVIADWNMPLDNGMELVTRIRTSSHSPNTMAPIILMTGFGSAEKINMARNHGVTEIVVKPFTAKDLNKRIMHIIKSPRDFIITDAYRGPDRRRRECDDFEGDNRRTGSKSGVQTIKPSPALQAKVGMGNLDEKAALLAQKVLDDNKVNFVPYANNFLKQLDQAITAARNEAHPGRRAIENVVSPVMQIKANSRIFKYDRLGDLAAVMMNFLEHLNELDADSLAIVKAHHTTLSHLVNNEIKGNGGEIGENFQTELENACNRYMISRSKMQQARLKEAVEASASS